MSELMNSVDAYIEFAEATNKFSDLAFYQRVKAALSRTDHADELAKALEAVIEDLALRAKMKGEDALDISHSQLMAADKALTNYREATE